VTANRDLHERRHPILKERTERGGARRRKQPTRTHTHDEGEQGEGKRD
jgi:hypothetical protein